MIRIILISCLCLNTLFSSVSANINAGDNEPAAELRIREPLQPNSANKSNETNEPVQPKGVTDFAASPFKLNTSIGQVPVRTRLRMVVESPLSAEESEVGETFKAKVRDDFYLEGDFRKLIIPKDSWVRGRVSYVKKPRLLSRSGKLGIKLDSLVTPQGDYVPLDADLTFMAGVVNENGLLDPQTGYGDKALEPTQALLDSTTGKVVSVATVGVPVVGSLVAGSMIALFSHGDAASVYPGQELQIIITRNTDLAM